MLIKKIKWRIKYRQSSISVKRENSLLAEPSLEEPSDIKIL